MNPASTTRSYWRGAAVLSLVVLGLVSLAGPAFAHEELVGSSPAEGAQLQRAPTQVELRFAGPVIAEGVAVTVTTTDGRHWESVPTQAAGTMVMTPVQTQAPVGRYRIGYRVVSSDGHPISGAVSYEVRTATDQSAPRTEPIDPPLQSNPIEESSPAVWLWIIAALVVLALAVIIVRRTE